MSTTTAILTPELIALYAAFKAKLMAGIPEDAKLAASEQLDSFECTLSQVTGAEITLKNTDAATDDLAVEAEVEVAAVLDVTESATASAEVASVDVNVDVVASATTDVVIEDITSDVSNVEVATAEVATANVSDEGATANAPNAADAVDEAGVVTSDVTTPAPPNSGAPTTAEQPSPRRSLRLRLACQEAALAVQDGSAIVSVTPSATGEGVHTRWHYPDDTVSVSATTSSGGEDGPSPDQGATVVGSSDDEKDKENTKGKRASAPSPSPYPPCPPPYVLVPSLKPSLSPSTTPTPSKKRALDEDSADTDGPARRTRSKVAFAAPPSPVGTRHRRRRAPTPGPRAARAPKVRSRSPSPSPPPAAGPSSTTTSTTISSSSLAPPTPAPSTRPLAAEQSFYHASDFSVFYDPSFGPVDKQPIGKDALPPWYKYSEVPEGIVNREVVREGEEGEWTVEKVLAKERDDVGRERRERGLRKVVPIPTAAAQVASTSRLPSPPPTPASASGGKRAREDDDDEEKEEGEEGRRTRARRE